MSEIPDFWRTEIWHPLTVHFPLALLLFATLFKAIAIFSYSKKWQSAGSLLLYFGAAAGWLAFYTGDLADGEVAKNLCDPTILKDHENGALAVCWIFSISAFFDLLVNQGLFQSRKKLINMLVLCAMLTGAAILTYAGHLGAQLVYQQAAGVYTPSGDCSEFE